MEFEHLLKKKTYYERFMSDERTRHPVQVLGEIYIREQQNDNCDLTYIRFAQGEIYFQSQDYETAIFKWENISNELQPWAKKNMADAYFELGLYSNAEDLYKSITTDSLCLNTEIALKLLSVYIELNKVNEALSVTNKVVLLNPDYESVTEIARSVYEEQQEWGRAVELAVNELVRTEDLYWYDYIRKYSENGFARSFEPAYFHQALVTLSKLDHRKFAGFISSLWKNYDNQEWFLKWMKEFNHITNTFETNDTETRYMLSSLNETAYLELTNGNYLLKELEELIPNLLTTWVRLSNPPQFVFPAAAIVAWNEMDVSPMSESTINAARNILQQQGQKNGMHQYCLNLYETIVNWAQKHKLKYTVNLRGEEQQEEIISTIILLLKNLHQSRVTLEKELLDTITTNNEMVAKLTGTVNQLKDIEQENKSDITTAFTSIKEKLDGRMKEDLPKLLRSCVDMINDESDVRTLHVQINNEINNRIEKYIEEQVLPLIHHQFQAWIISSQATLTDSNSFLEEMSETFNNAYGKEQLKLECDFSIIKDWSRDAVRMTSRVQCGKVDVFRKFSAKQFLLKNTSRLLGGLSPKKQIQTAYKTFLEKRGYDEEVREITDYFMLHLNLFENTLEKDISLFFSVPLQALNQQIEEIQRESQEKRNKLNSMKSYPEKYDDAFSIFQFRLRQFESMTKLEEREIQM